MCCSVLQYVAIRCSSSHELIQVTSSYAASCSVGQQVICSVLQCSAGRCRALQCVAVHCGAAQCGALHCSALQCSVTANQQWRTHDICSTSSDCFHECRNLAAHCNTLQHAATYCTTLHHAATHCTTLQPTATHCRGSTLQPTAMPCNTEGRGSYVMHDVTTMYMCRG